MKVLLTGAGGQLGRELLRGRPPQVELRAFDRAALDITDTAAVERAVSEFGPQVIVNAAAYTAVDRAEEEPDRAASVNARGVRNLALVAAASARLIHVSTDFVFSGDSSRPYHSSASPDPRSVYGKSKLDGERHALGEGGDSSVVVRTAWLYSRFGHNFVKSMLRLLASRDRLEVVADQIGSPTWARGLARAIWAIVERPEVAGIYHWTDAGVASWYDFAVAIQEEAAHRGMLEPSCQITPIPTSGYPTAARRPAFSVLDTTSTYRDLGMEPLHWRRQLRTMLQELDEYGGS